MTVNESDVRARIADLQRTGCNKTMAWSRSGAIAYVYGTTVRVRHLITPDGKSPDLSSAMTLGALVDDGNSSKVGANNSNNNNNDNSSNSTIHNGNGNATGNSNSTNTNETNGASNNNSGAAIPPHHPMVHVSWSPNGSDVACINSQGDISIYSHSGNHPNGLMTCLFNRSAAAGKQPDITSYELNAVVGFKWLDADKPILIPSPAMVNNEAISSTNNNSSSSSSTSAFATYGVSQARHCGPFTPTHQKNCCIAVTRKGLVRLIFQLPNESRYYEVTSALHNFSESNTTIDLVSHASFKSTRDNTLLLATYSPGSSNLKLYTISIDWSNVKQNNANGQSTTTTAEPASMTVKPLLKTTINFPDSSSVVETDTTATANGENGAKKGDAKYLTHLFLVPALPQVNKSQHQPPPTDNSDHELYAIFSSQTGSVVQTYHISQRPVSLHPSFYSLSVRRRDSIGSLEDTEPSLVLFNSYTTPTPVLALGTASQDTFLYTCQVNGTITVDKRPYNLPLQQQHQQQQRAGIVSLNDAGYVFPPPNNAASSLLTDICVSPNLVSYVYFARGSDRDLDVKLMYFPDDYRDRTNFVNSVVGLALRVSVSCFSSYFMDDICLLTKAESSSIVEKYGDHDLANRFIYTVLQESYRSNNFTVNIPKDYPSEKIFVNPSLQRLLSLQVSLGTSKNFKRDGKSRVAWCILNLRLMSFAITFTLRAISSPKNQQQQQQQQQHPQGAPVLGPGDFHAKAQHIQSMTGLVRWLTDFLSFICQELYLLSLESNQAGLFTEHTVSVSLSALLGRIPRALLIYCLRGTRGLEQMTGKFSEQENNPISGPVQAAHRALRETIQMSPVSLSSFEKMVSDIDSSMKNSNPPSNDTLEFEQNLIFKATVPSEFSSICQRIIQVFNQNLKPEINIPVLYFYDTSWLGLEQSPDDENNDDEMKLLQETDVLRKTIISSLPQNQKRECTRCGGVSAWDDQTTANSMHWTMAFQKNCLCGGGWYRG